MSQPPPVHTQSQSCSTLNYIIVLSRLLKKLKEKDDKQVEMEKREQGFVLYVSGANTQLGRSPTRAKSQAVSRHSKTAGGMYSAVSCLIFFKLQV